MEVGATDTVTASHAQQAEEDESASRPSRQNRKRQPPQWSMEFVAEVCESEWRKLQVLEDMRTENKLQVMKDLN